MGFNPSVTEDMLAWFLAIGSPVASTARFISFHTADPGTTGASEVSTGVIAAREQHDAWIVDTVDDGKVVNSGAGSVAIIGTATITHFGVWSAASGGTFYFGGDCTDQAVVNTNTITWADKALEAEIV